MPTVIVKNVKSGYESKIELPSVTKETAQAYVDRMNGTEATAMRDKLKIGATEYRLA